MSPASLRHSRLVVAFFSLAACLVFTSPNAQKALAAVLTNGDCSATINEGTGGNANGGIVLTDLGADCLIVFGSARATRTE